MISTRRRRYANTEDDNRNRSGGYGQTGQRYQQQDEDYDDEDYDDEDYDEEEDEDGNIRGQRQGEDYDDEDYDDDDEDDYEESGRNTGGNYGNMRGQYENQGGYGGSRSSRDSYNDDE